MHGSLRPAVLVVCEKHVTVRAAVAARDHRQFELRVKAVLEDHHELAHGDDGVGVLGRGRVFKLRGRVFLQEGRHPEALEQLLAAVDLMPEDREAWTLLGDVYDALGQSDEAAGARERAASLQGTN